MTRRALLVAVLAVAMACGCGRIGFDTTTSGDPGNPDGASGGDGGIGSDGATDASSSGSDGSLPDASNACAMPIAVNVGRTAPIDTCSQNKDRFDGCGPAGTEEVIFAFTAPTTRGYNFSAKNPGTNDVSHSTQRLDATCAPMNCAGILSFSVAAGQTVYFAVEASTGACAMIEFEVQ